jgi:hypothetical protein
MEVEHPVLELRLDLLLTLTAEALTIFADF